VLAADRLFGTAVYLETRGSGSVPVVVVSCQGENPTCGGGTWGTRFVDIFTFVGVGEED
jgi:hypothetical protein